MNVPANDAPFPEPFCSAALRCVETYQTHYGERLVAIYVFGSVHRGEAVPGVSDLDITVLTMDGFTSVDRQWEMERWNREQARSSEPGWVEIPLTRANDVGSRRNAMLPENEKRIRHLLTKRARNSDALNETETSLLHAAFGIRGLAWDATPIWGQLKIEAISPPDALWATFYIEHALSQARALTAQQHDVCQSPTDVARMLRKAARTAVHAGACLLMSYGAFSSFRGADTLPELRACLPEWNDFLRETELWFLALPVGKNPDLEAYLPRLAHWTEFVAEKTKDHSVKNAMQGTEGLR